MGRKILKSVFIGTGLLVCICCTPAIDVEEDMDLIDTFLQSSSFNPLNRNQGTTCYLDISSVGNDALKNSEVFNAMIGDLSQYSDTLSFILEHELHSVPLNRSEQSVFNALELAKERNTNKNYADILQAVENICYGNHQGLLITDYEFIKDGRYNDNNSYLSQPFKIWLQRGYQIDFLVEEYIENGVAKKRFYTFFTDPTDDAPISLTLRSCVKSFIDNGNCKWITVNSTDYGLMTLREENSCSEEISMYSVMEYNNHHNQSKLYIIDDTWENIREYVMKINKHGRKIVDECEIPLIDNLKIIGGQYYPNFRLKIRATNISMPFVANTEIGEGIEMKCEDPLDISDAFRMEVTEDSQILIYIRKEIMDKKHLYSKKNGFAGNLIKLEILVEDFNYNEYAFEQFGELEWISSGKNNPNKGKKAVCISNSLRNALQDKSVVPSAEQNRLLYTIFIQTESLN